LATKLIVTLPGQTFTSGTGNSGTPTAQTAGTAFNITLTAADASNKADVSYSGTKAISYSGPGGTPTYTASVTFTSGQATSVSTTLTKAETATITATDGSLSGVASSSLTVNAGAFTKLQVLMPGETAAPETASGKTGTPTAPTAGTPYTVTVYAVDSNWNVVNAVTDNVGITSSDANAALPANAALVAGTQTFSVTLKTAGTATITAADITDGGKTANTSPSIAVHAGPFSKLQLLVPGETVAPGTGSGKTGAPAAQTAGAAFTVTVNAVDANWNPVSSTDTVHITSSDGAATLPSDAALVGGTKTFSVTLNTAGTKTVTASDVTDGSRTANTSPSITVNAGTAAKLMVTLPGQTFTSGTGNSGTPTAQTAGAAFNITLTAVDASNNTDVSYSGTKAISYSGPCGTPTYTTSVTFTSGQATSVSTTLTKVEVTTISASDGTRAGLASSSLVVNAGAFTKLQVLTPGETAAPGTGSGKTGTPAAQMAGTAFTVTVNAVDANWNLVNTVADNIGITSSDVNAVLPSNAALVAGTKSFSVTLKTVGSATVTGSDITDGAKTANTSAPITVSGGTFTKLQLLVPGETAAPGTARGKTGTPAVQTAGTALTVTVNAVDANWNLVNTVTDNIGITSSDANAALPSNAALVGGTKSFSVTLKTAGTATITARDITNGGKTPNTSPLITVNARALGNFLVEDVGGGNIAPQTTGTAFYIKVTAHDAYNNTVTGFTGNVWIASNGVLLGSSVTSDAFTAGVQPAQSITITSAQLGTTLSATDQVSGMYGTSNSFTVNRGGVGNFLVEASGGGDIDPQTAGAPFGLRITARDYHNEPVTSFNGTATLETTAGTISPSSVSFVNGVATLDVTITEAGTDQAITATSGGLSGTSNVFTVNPGDAGNFLVEALGGGSIHPQTAGTAFDIRITARDQHNNTVTGFTGTVNLSTNAGTISPTSVVFASSDRGVVAVSVTLTQPGTDRRITATAASHSGTSNSLTQPGTDKGITATAAIDIGTSNNFTINTLPLDDFKVEAVGGGDISPQTAWIPFDIRITAQDANGNTVTSFNGTVEISSTGDLSLGSGTTAAFLNGVLASHSVALSAGGRYTITATKTRGAESGMTNSFTVNNPVPTATSISPNIGIYGGAPFTMTINGTNFVSTSVVRFNGSNRPTTFVSSTQLIASIPASDLTVTGSFPITVFNPTPEGGTSNAQTFTINNPLPSLTSISPSTATAGGAAFTLTATGLDFVGTSVIQWNGSNRATTYVSSSQLTASVSAADIATGGTARITVVNPSPGGGTSSAQTFTVNNPVPSITSLIPASANAGGAAFMLTVRGANFVGTSIVQWNGSSRTTSFLSSTQLTAAISAADIAAAGTASVTVVNPSPGGGTSNAQTFMVNNPVLSITSLSPAFAIAGGAAFTLTVNGTGFINPSTVKWNGSSRTTTYVSSSQLTAGITTSDIASAATASVTVVNPGGDTSNAQPFEIYSPTATMTLAVGMGRFSTNGGWVSTHAGKDGGFALQSWLHLPWDAYNVTGGGVHVAVGDVDGDGLDEIVMGLGTGGGGWIAIVDDGVHGYALLKWIQVGWDAYNVSNGEVFPAVGDIDGDGRAEIIAGLGTGSQGWIEIFGNASTGFQHMAWRQVAWPAYNAADGTTHPAVGDLDGDGKAEIVLGLGSGGGGWIEVIQSSAGDYSHGSWLQVNWPDYNASNGTTYPAVGDIDGDGRAEIVIGLGQGSGGWVEFLDDKAAGYAHLKWFQLPWDAYDNANGETHPAVGNLDADSRAEIVFGLGRFQGQGGWLFAMDDATSNYATLGWFQIPWNAFVQDGGETFPAIGRPR
jgi:hypothetical protein